MTTCRNHLARANCWRKFGNTCNKGRYICCNGHQSGHHIPIVFATVTDPVGSGFVASLARPGGNVTGFTLVEPTMAAKWVELLKEIAPRVNHVAMLFNPATATYADYFLKPFKPSVAASSTAWLDREATRLALHLQGVKTVFQCVMKFLLLAQSGDCADALRCLLLTPEWTFPILQHRLAPHRRAVQIDISRT